MYGFGSAAGASGVAGAPCYSIRERGKGQLVDCRNDPC